MNTIRTKAWIHFHWDTKTTMENDIGTMNTTTTKWLMLFRDAFLFIFVCFALRVYMLLLRNACTYLFCFALRDSMCLFHAARIYSFVVRCFVLHVSTLFSLTVFASRQHQSSQLQSRYKPRHPPVRTSSMRYAAHLDGCISAIRWSFHR